MLAYERGPFGVFERIRDAFGVLRYDNGDIDYDLSKGELAELIMCVWCLSPWIAAIWLVGYNVAQLPTMVISAVLALSAGAIVLERWNHG